MDSAPANHRLLKTLISCLHLLGASLLSYLIARRAPSLNDLRQWRHITWGRVCLLLVLVNSWLFVFSSGILVTGVGAIRDPAICKIAIFSCLFFIGSTKILINAFLIERSSRKAYIVWSGGFSIPRFKMKLYKICGTILVGYTAVYALWMGTGYHIHIRKDQIQSHVGTFKDDFGGDMRHFAEPFVHRDLSVAVMAVVPYESPITRNSEEDLLRCYHWCNDIAWKRGGHDRAKVYTADLGLQKHLCGRYCAKRVDSVLDLLWDIIEACDGLKFTRNLCNEHPDRKPMPQWVGRQYTPRINLMYNPLT
uniref:Uncharacterized protein n=1 Tax=Moniliophthora roreri TaxID=221103 RepID=A0A0W0F0A7_MONRR